MSQASMFKVMLMLMLMLLVSCGGEPDGLFATTRVMAGDSAVAPESSQEDSGAGGGQPPQPDAESPPEGGLGGAAGSLGGSAGSAQAEPGPEPQPEAGAADATCWPPEEGCACPCYRNHAMDGYCPDERPSAWVCTGCAPAGCKFSYDAQASLACCP